MHQLQGAFFLLLALYLLMGIIMDDLIVAAVYNYISNDCLVSPTYIPYEGISQDMTIKEVSKDTWLVMYKDYIYCETKNGVYRTFFVSYLSHSDRDTIYVQEVMPQGCYKIEELIEGYIKDLDNGQND